MKKIISLLLLCLPFIVQAQVVSINLTTIDAPEQGGNIQLRASLDAAIGTDVTVTFATADLTATAGTDYTAKTGTMVITAGNTLSANEAFSITDDADVESTEFFTITLSAPTSGTLGDAVCTVRILSDDAGDNIGKGVQHEASLATLNTQKSLIFNGTFGTQTAWDRALDRLAYYDDTDDAVYHYPTIEVGHHRGNLIAAQNIDMGNNEILLGADASSISVTGGANLGLFMSNDSTLRLRNQAAANNSIYASMSFESTGGNGVKWKYTRAANNNQIGLTMDIINTDVLGIDWNGQLRLHEYDGTNFNQNATAGVKLLSLDPSDGSIGYHDVPTGGGGGLTNGTAANSTLNWSGTAWVENTEFRTYTDRVRIPNIAGNPSFALGQLWYNTTTDHMRYADNGTTAKTIATIEDHIEGTATVLVKNASATLQAEEVFSKWSADLGQVDITLDTSELIEGVVYTLSLYNNDVNTIRFVTEAGCTGCTIDASGQVSGLTVQTVVVGTSTTGFKAPDQVYTVRRKDNAFYIQAGGYQAENITTNGLTTSTGAAAATGTTAVAIPGLNIPVVDGAAYKFTIFFNAVHSDAAADPIFSIVGFTGTRHWLGFLESTNTGGSIMSEYSANNDLEFPAAAANGTRAGKIEGFLYPSSTGSVTFEVACAAGTAFTVNTNARCIWERI